MTTLMGSTQTKLLEYMETEQARNEFSSLGVLPQCPKKSNGAENIVIVRAYSYFLSSMGELSGLY